MKEKLTNNWGLKLISVCLAMLMWLVVINESNPIERRSVTVTNIKYLNEDVVIDSGKTYTVGELENRGISISVPVRKQDARKVQGDDFQIVIDLAKIGPYGTVEIDVEWLGSGDREYEITESEITWRTTTVTVTLEDIIERTYPVLLKTTGEPADEYILGEESVVSPRSVTIKAPQSVMERIRSAGIEVNINGLNSEASGEAALILYDVAGEELILDYEEFEEFEFSISQQKIAYTIPLLKTKEVRLNFAPPEGTVAEGYRYTGRQGGNQTVHIAGLRGVLADIDTIEIPSEALNLEGARQNVELELDISRYVPEGVTVESDNIVKVTLAVEPLIRQTRELLPEKIRMEDGQEGWNYTIRGSVLVVLEGLEDDLNALTDDMLDAWLSLDGLEEGENQVEVQVTAGNAFTLVQVGRAAVTMEAVPETGGEALTGTASGANEGTAASDASSASSTAGETSTAAATAAPDE
ncbi:MAG: hypothetical protein HFI39_10400 [Lachnospiraceae bacterium]|nr:hypothetical protein [Lachnospiraceae bacterium]